jgi:hypothetical protein
MGFFTNCSLILLAGFLLSNSVNSAAPGLTICAKNSYNTTLVDFPANFTTWDESWALPIPDRGTIAFNVKRADNTNPSPEDIYFLFSPTASTFSDDATNNKSFGFTIGGWGNTRSWMFYRNYNKATIAFSSGAGYAFDFSRTNENGSSFPSATTNGIDVRVTVDLVDKYFIVELKQAESQMYSLLFSYTKAKTDIKANENIDIPEIPTGSRYFSFSSYEKFLEIRNIATGPTTLQRLNAAVEEATTAINTLNNATTVAAIQAAAGTYTTTQLDTLANNIANANRDLAPSSSDIPTTLTTNYSTQETHPTIQALREAQRNFEEKCKISLNTTPAPDLPVTSNPTPAPALPVTSNPTPAPALPVTTNPTPAPALPVTSNPTPAPTLPVAPVTSAITLVGLGSSLKQISTLDQKLVVSLNKAKKAVDDYTALLKASFKTSKPIKQKDATQKASKLIEALAKANKALNNKADAIKAAGGSYSANAIHPSTVDLQKVIATLKK